MKTKVFSLTNFLISLGAFLPLLIMIDYKSLTFQNSFIFIFVLLYILIISFRKSRTIIVKKNDVSIKLILLSFFIEVICWLIIALCFFLLFDLNILFNNQNTYFVFLYFILLSRVFFNSFAYRILGLRITNNSAREKIKILIMNYICIFPVTTQYIFNLYGWNVKYENVIIFAWFVLLLINIFYRIFVRKNQTLLEYLFGLYVWDEKK